MTGGWRRALGSYWSRVTLGLVCLFLVLPVVVGLVWSALAHTPKFAEGYPLGVYIGTGVAVLWYTVETYYLRRATVMPIVVARIQSHPVGHVAGIGATYAQKVVLQNVGKSAPLFVQVLDFDHDVTEGNVVTYKHIQGVDVIEAGEAAPVESVGYLGQTEAYDTLVPFLKPTAPRTLQITIRYDDIDGGKHESVMQMGKGGIRLVRHS
jgi:hypothetical protein